MIGSSVPLDKPESRPNARKITRATAYDDRLSKEKWCNRGQPQLTTTEDKRAKKCEDGRKDDACCLQKIKERRRSHGLPEM